jgi:hypothetical protein
LGTSELRGTDEIGEEHRCKLSLLSGTDRPHRCAAREAEPGLCGKFDPALHTLRHQDSLGPV